MRAKKWLSGLIAAVVAAGCGQPTAVTPQEEFRTEKSLLSAGVTKHAMPLAKSEAGDTDPARVLPMAEALNHAWRPILGAMAPGKATLWGDAAVALVAEPDEVKALCDHPVEFALDQSHGVYCRAPKPASASPYTGNILFPDGLFQDEIAMTPEAKKPGAMMLMAYFYTLHLRRLMADMGLAPTWPETSRTQWCLAGASLRALWPQAEKAAGPASGSTPAPSAAPPALTLGLTHVFSGTGADDRHEDWVREGVLGSNVNACFALE